MWFHLSLVGLSLAVAATQAEQAEELVRKLGRPEFAVRQRAEEGLLRLGPAALPAVRAGLKSGDTEVRSRCQRVLPPLEAAYWRQEADAFETDRGGRRPDLPLWGEYRKLVGADPAARQLFAEMVRANGRLLQKMATDKAAGRKAYPEECRKLHEALKAAGGAAKARPGELAALLLASHVLKADWSDWKEPGGFSHLLGAPGLAAAVKDPKLEKPFVRLLLDWAERQSVADVTPHQFFLCFVSTEGCEECLPAVRRLIRDKNAAGVNHRAPAVAVLAKVGGKRVAAELERLWGDEAVLFTPAKSAKGQLGDQALAASIRLAGKDPKDYGMNHMDLTLRGPDRAWHAPIYWFASDADRKAALKKWKARKAK